MKIPSGSRVRLGSVVAITLFLGVGVTEVMARPGARSGSYSGSREGARGGSVSVEGQSYGRYRSGSVEAEGPNGGSYDASGSRYGRFGSASSSAEGPNGGTVDRSATRYGRYGDANVNVDSNNVNVNRSVTTWNGYRPNYIYRGGAYVPANVVVNTAYVATVGLYAGWSVIARPAYVAYPAFATYPVEVSVQVQLKELGYYGGPIDGNIGPSTQQAISKYQAAQGIAVTGTITQALLSELGIS